MPGLSAAPRGKTELAARWRTGAGDYVVSADIARDGKLCAIGTGAGDVLVVDALTGGPVWRARVHPAGVFQVAFSRDGKALATSGQDDKARVFAAVSGERLLELPGGSPWVEHVAWSAAGDRLAIASGKRVRVFSRDGHPEVETEPLPSTVAALAFRAQGGAELAAACYGGVHLWNVAARTKSRILDFQGSLISMVWSPDGKVLACGSQDCSVHFWRLKGGQDSEMTGYPLKPKALAWDARSSLLATSGAANVTVWDFTGKGPEGSRPILLDAHQGPCTALAFAPIGGALASGSQDAGVLVWEPRAGRKPTRFAFLEDEVTALLWHPDQTGLLGADASGSVVFWDVK